MSPAGHLRCLVSGGGITGCATALALRQAGMQVTTVDLSHRPGTQYNGMGCLMPANAMAALKKLGVADKVTARAHALRRMVILGEKGSKAFGEVDLDDVSSSVGLSHGFHSTTLEDVHQVLLGSLKKTGSGGSHAVRYGTGVKSVSEGKEGQLAIALTGKGPKGGSMDVLIGADGLGSNVRQACMPGVPAAQPTFAGFGIWHLILEQRPATVEDDTVLEIWGSGARFGMMPLPGGKLYCYGAVAAQRPERIAPHQRAATFAKAFEGFHGHGSEAVCAAVMSGECGSVDIMFDYPAYLTSEAWSQNRTVVLGDAAHAFPPNAATVYSGQSLAACLGDAVSIAEALQEVGPGEDVSSALGKWASERQKAVDAEQAAAANVTRESHNSADASGLRSWLQSTAMAAVGSVGRLGYPALLRNALMKL